MIKHLTKLFAFLLLVSKCSISHSQTFSLVFHEYDDFPNIDEIVHGDFNNDGSLDFIISAPFANDFRIGLGNGIERPEFLDMDNSIRAEGLTVIDFDNDGDLDFVGFSPFMNASFVWLNDGAANFTREELNINDYDSIHFTDLNNNGIMNVVVGIDDQVRIYNLVQGALSLNQMIFDDSFAGSPLAINSTDFDEDGDEDILVTFAFDGLILFRQDANFNFSQEVLYGETFNDSDLHIVEFNNDGIPDFVVQSDFERKSAILLSGTNGDYTELELPRMFGPNLFTDVADFDGDGNVEILQADSESFSDAGVSLFSYDNTNGTLDQQVIAEDHADTEDGGIADLNGDGILDFYLYANDFSNTGIAFYIQVQDLDGDGFSSEEDCDDTNADINPGQMEVPYNGLDDDCDPSTFDDDLDQDGFLLVDDCDDTNPNINPDRTEIPYNGADDDCDPTTLDDDLDQDGFLLADDCDDTNPSINPGATEIANNGIDEDCDGMDLVTATHELSSVKITIYPNPATNFIYIVGANDFAYEAKIFNIEGRIIHSSVNKKQIPLNNIQAGTYTLQIKHLATSSSISEQIIILK